MKKHFAKLHDFGFDKAAIIFPQTGIVVHRAAGALSLIVVHFTPETWGDHSTFVCAHRLVPEDFPR